MNKGPWSRRQIESFLEDTPIPVRLACQGTSGHPTLVSLWFLPLEGLLWCATQRSAHVVSMLGRDARCSFEVSVETPPYRGVRGPAIASIHEDRGEEILRQLIARYLPGSRSKLASLLLSRVENETAIAIEPLRTISWDYSKRMKEAE